jgi:hypothetical protein
MQTDSIESILGRLMPQALGESCQFELESVFDEENKSEIIPRVNSTHSPLGWKILLTGIAATITGLLVHGFLLRAPVRFTTPNVKPNVPGVVLVGESDRVQSMKDEGWCDNDGAAMRAVRLNVVAGNRLRDEETGILIQISEPREELLLTPISNF